jgi:hypothetical protein
VVLAKQRTTPLYFARHDRAGDQQASSIVFDWKFGLSILERCKSITFKYAIRASSIVGVSPRSFVRSNPTSLKYASDYYIGSSVVAIKLDIYCWHDP